MRGSRREISLRLLPRLLKVHLHGLLDVSRFKFDVLFASVFPISPLSFFILIPYCGYIINWR